MASHDCRVSGSRSSSPHTAWLSHLPCHAVAHNVVQNGVPWRQGTLSSSILGTLWAAVEGGSLGSHTPQTGILSPIQVAQWIQATIWSVHTVLLKLNTECHLTTGLPWILTPPSCHNSTPFTLLYWNLKWQPWSEVKASHDHPVFWNFHHSQNSPGCTQARN